MWVFEILTGINWWKRSYWKNQSRKIVNKEQNYLHGVIPRLLRQWQQTLVFFIDIKHKHIDKLQLVFINFIAIRFHVWMCSNVNVCKVPFLWWHSVMVVCILYLIHLYFNISTVNAIWFFHIFCVSILCLGLIVNKKKISINHISLKYIFNIVDIFVFNPFKIEHSVLIVTIIISREIKRCLTDQRSF